MVTICKNGITQKVTNGAFREIFEPQGWQIAGAADDISEAEEVFIPETTEPEDPEEKPETGENKVSAEEKSADLSEIPLSEMDLEQLKAYAEQLGVIVPEGARQKTIRQAIRKALGII